MDLVITIAAIGLLFAVPLVVMVDTVRVGISPMPSSAPARRAALDHLAAHHDPRCVVEVGAGWGGLAVAAARRFPHAAVVALEAAIIPAAFLWLRVRLGRLTRLGPRNLRVQFGGLGAVDWTRCDGVLCYIHPGGMRDLADQVAPNLPPGAAVASITFALPGHRPVRTTRVADLWRSPVYLYTLVPDATSVD